MSKKSSSETDRNKTSETEQASKEMLTDDENFWDLETTKEELEITAEEKAELEKIDQILQERTQRHELKSLSEHEPDMDLPCEEDNINSLDKHRSNFNTEVLPDHSDNDPDTLLTHASANAISEGQSEVGLENTELAESHRNIKSPLEKVATLICYLLIIAVFGYLINYASNQHDFSVAMKDEIQLPAEGEFANIEEIETFWSEPESNNTRFGVILVPSATITLGSGTSSGAIRTVFYSYEEDLNGNLRPKGDPFTLEFQDGKFLATGSNKITIHGTDGFDKLAHFIHYRSQYEERWTVEIKEAPSSQTEVNNFEFLTKVPAEPIRK